MKLGREKHSPNSRSLTLMWELIAQKKRKSFLKQKILNY